MLDVRSQHSLRSTRSPEQGGTPEEHLAAAVLLKALSDAGITAGYGLAAAPAERSQAVEFLTASRGDWRAAREAWCEAANVDPDWLREVVLRVQRHGKRVRGHG
jgi:hypothetical protein